MTGDTLDMLARLKSALPTRWFADESPILDGTLTGLASGWAWVSSLLTYVRAQTRIATATAVWLDIIAKDFFGPRVFRRPGEMDEVLRLRIQRELVRERGTRVAVTSVLKDLTGRVPRVFEPARPADTGGYGSMTGAGGGVGWGVAGGWGSLALPFQCFVTAFRPRGSGIAFVAGWGGLSNVPGGGAYGAGAIEYASLAMVQGQISDADIRRAITEVLPATAIAWVSIDN